MKSETKPASASIKKIFEVISVYSFNMYYMNVKYMPLSDFLS